MCSVGFHSFPAITTTSSSSSSSATTSQWNPYTPIKSFFPSTGPKVTQLAKNPIQRWSRSAGPYRGQGLSGARMSAVDLLPSMALMRKAVEISDAMKGTSIFLVGINCTMKTNLARVLAEALRYYYFDSDSLVVEAAGGELDAETFPKTDESGFRDSETEVLKQLSSMGRLVVCAGDGAVQSVTNLAYLRYGISIWIDVPLDVLADEVLKKRTLQLVAQNTSKTVSYLEVHDELTKRYRELKEGYATADATISVQRLACELGYDDLGTVTPDDLALEVLKHIEKLTRVKKMMEEAAKPF